jgi:hypothetical protein
MTCDCDTFIEFVSPLATDLPEIRMIPRCTMLLLSLHFLPQLVLAQMVAPFHKFLEAGVTYAEFKSFGNSFDSPFMPRLGSNGDTDVSNFTIIIAATTLSTTETPSGR